jgi:hypothetical protein
VFRFEGLGTSKYSIVTASITELGPDLAPDGPVDLPFVGAAAMSILNVSSGGDGVVYVNINVNYPTDVWVQVSLMIINPST